MSKKLFRTLLWSSAFASLLLIMFQNCGPATLSGQDQSSQSNGNPTPPQPPEVALGTKVDLSTLLSSQLEKSDNLVYPTASMQNEVPCAVGNPIIENIILRQNDFSQIIWVHGSTSTVVSTGDSLQQLKCASVDSLGLYYVFGYRQGVSYFITSFKVVNRTTASQNVNAENAVQFAVATITTDALNELILVMLNAPDVDLSSVQFSVQNSGVTTNGKRSILVPKKIRESVNIQVELKDASGQIFSDVINLPGVPTPEASLSVNSLDFGSVTLGSSSNVQSLTIKNIGTAALKFPIPLSVSDDFSFSGNCNNMTSLNPGDSCAVNLWFTPTGVGIKSGTLTIGSNAWNSPNAISLTGKGLPAPAPQLSLSANSINIGSVTMGSTSSARVLTLKNTGNAQLKFTVPFSVNNDFSLTGNCSINTPLDPGASCTVNLTFTPTVIGPKSSTLTVNSNVSGSPHSISMMAEGVPPPAPQVSLSVSALDFGNRIVNLKSSTLSVVLKNTGNANLNTSLAWTIIGDFALVPNNCSPSLVPGASCSIGVSMTPKAVGPRNGLLRLVTDAPNSPHTITLTGYGLPGPDPIISGRNYRVILSCGSQNRALTMSGDQAIVGLRNDALIEQSFKFETFGSGYKIISQSNGNTLSPNMGVAHDAVLYTVPFTGDSSQIFVSSISPDGYYRFQNLKSELFMDSTADLGGMPFYQKPESTNCLQKFKMVLIP